MQCNTAQINGVTPSMNSGTNDTGTQRITLATDDSLNTTSDLIAIKYRNSCWLCFK